MQSVSERFLQRLGELSISNLLDDDPGIECLSSALRFAMAQKKAEVQALLEEDPKITELISGMIDIFRAIVREQSEAN